MMAAGASKAKFQELRIGQLISSPHGTFRVNSLIAYGKCCVTYEGENVEEGAAWPWVALKLFSSHQDYRGALLRETALLRALHGQKHVVHQLCHVCTAGGEDVLVQELLTGTVAHVATSLQADHATPSPWLLYTLATHAASGLRCLHERGLVHGDVKTHNIMWSAERAAFVLIDFGLSTKVGENYRHKVHSPDYSAPEVMSWNKAVEEDRCSHVTSPGESADVWALGCTMVRFSLGERVFPDGLPTSQEALDRLIGTRLAAPAAGYPPTYTADLSTYIKSCLRLDPRARATARELCLLPWLSGPQHRQPTHQDLLLLPTPLLRITNLALPAPHSTGELESLVSACGSYGSISERWQCPATGDLFLLYSASLDAEAAYTELKDKHWKDRTLVPTFYPPELYSNMRRENRNSQQTSSGKIN